uniref:Uncharacterized protein n=1 Tax=Moniliophthora roreri TaxID=221103 RepID=A0A0W0FNR1_MONRR
MVDLLATST